MSAPPLPVFLYADYACPHSLIVYGRLAGLAAEGRIAVLWRGLPGPRSPVDDTLRDSIRELSRAAAELGYPLSIPSTRPDTHDACRAAEFARDCGVATLERLNEALFRAVLCEKVDVGERAELLEVAERSGLDRTGLERALEDDRYDPALAETEREAEKYGIGATPTLLIGSYKVVGAAPVRVLRDTIERAGGEPERG